MKDRKINGDDIPPTTTQDDASPVGHDERTDAVADGQTAAECKVAPPSKKAVALNVLGKYIVITIGCVFYALGIALFVEPANLASGGMTGISLIISELSGFPTGYLLIILNVPMLVLGLIFFGWKFIVSTAYATILSGLLMKLCTRVFGANGLNLLPFTDNILINAVVGAVLFAVGMGLIFRMGASTAGTDIIVKILRKKFRYIKTGMISMVTDMIVVGCSFFVHHDIEKLFYTALLVVVFTLIFDFVLYGGNTAKMVFVISTGEKAENICRRVLKEVDTGATFIDAKGGYTGHDRRILLCVVKPFLYPKLKDVVREEDKNAFIIVSSAKEIYGLGYRNQDDAEL